MAALDNIASELLKSANEADLNYKKTRDQAQRDKAVRLRRIVENLRQLVFGASDLNGLSDVTLSAPANGQVLTYNSTTTQWENQTPGGGGGGGDMYKSTYDVDNDGIVDGSETTQIIVRNSTGSTLLKGQVVYLSGATGNRPNAVLSQANTEATSSKTIGIVVANINNNSDGYVAVNGTLHDLDTSAFADGVAVWLSATTAGAFTSTIPAEPNHTVFIGYIARSHPTQGRLVILIQNGYELNELHGVQIASEANNDLLVYESSSTLWKNKSIATIFGGTPLVSVPTLAQVTTAGNTTTNAITVGGLTSTANINAGSNLIGRSDWGQGIINFGGTGEIRFQNSTGGGFFYTWYQNGNVERMRLSANNNLLIGTTTDAGYKLDVNGTARVTDNAFFNKNITVGSTTAATDNLISLLGPSNGFFRVRSLSGAVFLGLGDTLNGSQGNMFGLTRSYLNEYGNTVNGIMSTDNIPYSIRFGAFGSSTEALRITTSQITSYLKFVTTGSITAASALAQGVFFNNTLVAAANNDVLVGLDINPTFTNGAFTGVTNLAARIQGNTEISRTGADTMLTVARGGGASFIIQAKANSTSTSEGVNLYWTNNTWLKFVLGSSVVANFSNVGNLLVGTSTDSGFKLDVVGADSRFNGVRVGLGAGGVSTNTVVGNGALNANTTGSGVTAIGYQSLYSNTTASNTAVGYQALNANTTGGGNTAVGFQSSFLNSVGANNSSFGFYSLRSNTAFSNTAIGYYSLFANVSGSNNTAVGTDALRSNTAASNTAVGTQAGYSNTSGGITAVGYRAGYNNTSGTNLTALGFESSFSNVTSTGNTSIGFQALYANTAANNTAIGDRSLTATTTGTANTAIGSLSMRSNVDGGVNVALGVSSLFSNISGNNNIAVGYQSLFSNTASNNTALGYQAGQAGVANTTGTNNIFIGYQSTGVSATESNRTWIGNSSTTSTWLAGNVLVGTTTDAGYKLDVNGTARFAGQIAGSNGLSITGGNIISQTGANSGRMTMLNLRNTGGGFQSAVGTSLAIAFTNREVAGVWTDDVIENVVYSNTAGAVTTGYSFYTHSNQLYNTSPVLAMSINGTNVGIGTPTPTDKLHIVDNTTGNKFARISAGAADASAAWVAQNDQVDNIVYRVFGSGVSGSQMGVALSRSASLIANLGGSGKFLIGTFSATDLVFGTNDQERMRLVNNTGNFLIGTLTDVGTKLNVSGDVNALGYRVNNVVGYTGILNIPGNPPGQQNVDIQGGIIINIF